MNCLVGNQRRPAYYTDLLDPHAGLLPMELLLKKICHRSALRICSLSPTNPVSALAKTYTTRPASRHITSIQSHCSLFRLNPSTIEKIPAIQKSANPKYRSAPVQDKDQSIEYEKYDRASIRVAQKWHGRRCSSTLQEGRRCAPKHVTIPTG